MLGKLNMDEFAMGSSNETSAYGPVISPWKRNDGGNAALTPGGIVGRVGGGGRGAAWRRASPAPTPAARSASPRLSPAFRGIKPTYGRCSRWGIVAFASSLDQAGPMARTVRDCAIMLEVMGGFDPKDATSLDLPVPQWEAGLSSDLQGQEGRHSDRISHRRRSRRDRRAVGPGRRMAARRRRRAGQDQPAAHRICAADLLHHRPGRGLVEPRPL